MRALPVKYLDERMAMIKAGKSPREVLQGCNLGTCLVKVQPKVHVPAALHTAFSTSRLKNSIHTSLHLKHHNLQMIESNYATNLHASPILHYTFRSPGAVHPCIMLISSMCIPILKPLAQDAQSCLISPTPNLR